jgi:hypothetical protein
LAIHRAESFEGTWSAHDRQILQVCGDRRARKTFWKAVAKVGRELAIGPSASTDDRSQHGVLVCFPLGMKTNLQASVLPLSIVVAYAVHTSRLSMRRTRSRLASTPGPNGAETAAQPDRLATLRLVRIRDRPEQFRFVGTNSGGPAREPGQGKGSASAPAMHRPIMRERR